MRKRHFSWARAFKIRCPEVFNYHDDVRVLLRQTYPKNLSEVVYAPHPMMKWLPHPQPDWVARIQGVHRDMSKYDEDKAEKWMVALDMHMAGDKEEATAYLEEMDEHYLIEWLEKAKDEDVESLVRIIR